MLIWKASLAAHAEAVSVVKQVHKILLAISGCLSLAVLPMVLVTSGNEWGRRAIMPPRKGAHAPSGSNWVATSLQPIFRDDNVMIRCE